MEAFYKILNSVSRSVRIRTHGASIEFYEKAAEQGSVEALVSLGDIYCDGSAFSPDESTALKYYRKAAALGNGEAMYRIAKIYARGGNGIQADGGKALKWFEKAAAYGNCKAMLVIGETHCADKELHKATNKVLIDNAIIKRKPDLTKAVSWFKKAEESCHGNQDELAEVYYEIASAIFRQSKKPGLLNYAKKYLKKAAESGNESAMLDLADYYFDRRDCEKEAIRWCKNALEHGNGKGMLLILERLHRAKTDLMEKDEEIHDLHSRIEMLHDMLKTMELINDEKDIH